MKLGPPEATVRERASLRQMLDGIIFGNRGVSVNRGQPPADARKQPLLAPQPRFRETALLTAEAMCGGVRPYFSSSWSGFPDSA